MSFSRILKSSIPYVVPVLIFLVVSSLYFSPAFDGYDVKQADVVNYRGMSNDLNAFHEKNPDEEPLWTNSMFGGMPSIQITAYELGNDIDPLRKVIGLGLPHPVNILFLYFIGFFFLGLVLRINPWISAAGALAFGFSSYFLIIIEAGHVTKAYAIAFMAPVVGAFIMAYRRNLIWGVLLSAFFMMLEIGSNHLQITYYLGFLLIGLGVLEVVRAIKSKSYKRLFIASAGVIVAYGLAIMSSAANIMVTQEYANETIRGKNNLTIAPDLRENDANSTADGLDRDYVTQWSYGKSESLTFLIPYAKGGHSIAIGNGEFSEDLKTAEFRREAKEFIAQNSQYWGDQPFTSGPVYVGALVFLLAIVGLFFIKSAIKWPLLVVTILTLFLSWGKNMMWFTDFFLDYFPMYSKFRAVTIILVILELCMPILAILFLHQLYKNRGEIAEQRKKFLLISSVVVAFMLFLIASPSSTGLYSQAEMNKMSDPEFYIGAEVREQVKRIPKEQLVQYGVQNPNDPKQVELFIQAVVKQQADAYESNMPELGAFRASIFTSDAFRSFGLMLLGIGMILILLFVPSVKAIIPIGVICVVMVVDLINLDLKYLNTEGEERRGEKIYNQWQKVEEKRYPLSPKEADIQILEAEMAANPELRAEIDKAGEAALRFAKENDYSRTATNNYIQRERFRVYNESTNFRVADVTDPVSSSSRASYWHESVGGYHGAKLRRYQNLFEFDYIPYDRQVLNMLNTKYIIQGTEQGPAARRNAGAMGNVWLTRSVVIAEDEDEEILKLGKIYSIESQSGWKLSVNDEQKEKAQVYGREDIVVSKDQDSILVQWPDGLTVATTAYLVTDTNGTIEWVNAGAVEQDTTDSFTSVLKLIVDYNFDPSKMTIVNADNESAIGKTEFSGKGKIELKDRTLNKITYEFESDEEQLAVFSEIYYPLGWTAKIDGKEVEHIRVNYVLRGLKIPAGKHTIEFEVNTGTYEKGVLFARIGSSLVYLLLLAGLVYEILNRRRKKVESEE